MEVKRESESIRMTPLWVPNTSSRSGMFGQSRLDGSALCSLAQTTLQGFPNGPNVAENYSQLWRAPGMFLDTGTGSIGSSSDGSKHHDEMFLNSADTKCDELQSPDIPRKIKKKRIRRSSLGLKGGKGLRHFSLKVCKKVESKGWTTYNEVASELVSEIVDASNNSISQDQHEYDEKNIRRRVYDALNVLMAMDIISKEKKEIRWKGLPTANINSVEQIKNTHKEVRSRIDRKKAYLQELQEQIKGLENLMLRNEREYQTGNNPSGRVTLPFILIKTRPHATVDIEISEDMQLVHLDFNSTPFELHDDASVLKAMQIGKSYKNTVTEDHKPGNESVSKCELKNPLLSQILGGKGSSHLGYLGGLTT